MEQNENYYPWSIDGDGELGPSVGEMIAKAAELFPGVPLGEVRVASEWCCRNPAANCKRTRIGLSRNTCRK